MVQSGPTVARGLLFKAELLRESETTEQPHLRGFEGHVPTVTGLEMPEETVTERRATREGR